MAPDLHLPGHRSIPVRPRLTSIHYDLQYTYISYSCFNNAFLTADTS